MRLTVVFLVVAVLICAMIQESEQFFGRHYRRGHRGCRRTTSTTTTTTTTQATTTQATTSASGRRKREIMAAPLLSALTYNKHEETGSDIKAPNWYLHKKNSLYEKSLFIDLEEDTYHVEITHTCTCSSTLTEKKDLKLCQYENLINEGANVLLMRYLSITNFEGTLRFQNITINGNIAISDYICSALRNMELQGNHQETYTIDRRIYEKDSLIEQIKVYLTSQGRILEYDWLDTLYIAQKDPLMLNDTNKNINAQISLKEEWMQNIEMHSKYLDVKSYNVAQYTEYLMDHPEIKQLIADYIQSLLIVKPIDVIYFTIQHFKAFARE